MKIPVIVDYDTVEKVDARDLRTLIEEGRIIAFRRSGGWVRVGTDPLRGDGGSYDGPERRNFHQGGVRTLARGFHLCVLGRKRERDE